MKLKITCHDCGEDMEVKGYRMSHDEGELVFECELECPQCTIELDRYRYLSGPEYISERIWKL